MREKHRNPEVPEERVPVVEYLDRPARITSKELAITHSLFSGILQNVCFTITKVLVGFEKSARMHIIRLMINPVKGPKE